MEALGFHCPRLNPGKQKPSRITLETRTLCQKGGWCLFPGGRFAKLQTCVGTRLQHVRK